MPETYSTPEYDKAVADVKAMQERIRDVEQERDDAEGNRRRSLASKLSGLRKDLAKLVEVRNSLPKPKDSAKHLYDRAIDQLESRRVALLTEREALREKLMGFDRAADFFTWYGAELVQVETQLDLVSDLQRMAREAGTLRKMAVVVANFEQSITREVIRQASNSRSSNDWANAVDKAKMAPMVEIAQGYSLFGLYSFYRLQERIDQGQIIFDDDEPMGEDA